MKPLTLPKFPTLAPLATPVLPASTATVAPPVTSIPSVTPSVATNVVPVSLPSPAKISISLPPQVPVSVTPQVSIPQPVASPVKISIPSVSQPAVSPVKISLPQPSIQPSVVLPTEKKEEQPTKIPVMASPSKPTLKISAPSFTPSQKPKEEEKEQNLHLETFFGIRNFINGETLVKGGTNYDKESLKYMTSQNRAEQITNLIIQKMADLGIEDFEVFETSAGLGGNTMSFLEKPQITRVVAYEIDPERYRMFLNNVQMYKLESKLIPHNEAYPSFVNSGNDYIIFYDAPWLPAATSPIGSNVKNLYILEGMKIGDKTLEQLVMENQGATMHVFKLPPDYKLNEKEMPNHTVEYLPFKNILIAIVQKNVDPEKEAKRQELQRRKDVKLGDDAAWRESLRNFLRNNFLKLFISSEDVRAKLTNDEAMDIWEIAFTHESYNPNVGENYEELELQGDAVMMTNFYKYLRYQYQNNITRFQLSEFKTYYLSKPFQSKLARKYGLGDFVRTRFTKTIHVYEDIMESVFGALDDIGDKVFKFGAGNGLAYNLIVYLFDQVEIDWNITRGNPKTQVKEMFENLGWVNPKAGEVVPEHAIENDDGTTTFFIKFPVIAIGQLKALGVTLQTDILAQFTANTKKLASDQAYKIALNNLTRLNITKEWVKEVKERRELESPELAPYVPAAMKRLKEEGYVKFEWAQEHMKSLNKATNKFVQLIGVRADGRKAVLLMNTEPTKDVIEAKQIVLSHYAKGDAR